MRTLFAILLLSAVSSPALAAATPWQNVADGVRLRLITSDIRKPGGSTLVGLQLTMPDGDRTYWRNPGESGIPTIVDIAGSTGVSAAQIHWPVPQIDKSAGVLDYVYRGATILPVSLAVDGPAPVLRAAVVMGICSDVCVPVRASFALPLEFGAADPGQSIRLQQALAEVPIAWDKPSPPFASVRYDAAAKALHIALDDDEVDPGSIIATGDDPALIFDAPQKSPDGRSVLLPLRDAPDGGWAGGPLTLTFTTPRGAFDVSARAVAG